MAHQALRTRHPRRRKAAAVAAALAPSAPTGLTATASSSSVIGLSWKAVTPPANCTISSYSVYGSTTSGFTPSSSNLIASGLTGPSYSNTGLPPRRLTTTWLKRWTRSAHPRHRRRQSATTQAAASGTEIVAIAAGGPARKQLGGGDYSFVADEDFSGGGDNGAVSCGHHQFDPTRCQCGAHGGISERARRSLHLHDSGPDARQPVHRPAALRRDLFQRCGGPRIQRCYQRHERCSPTWMST